jgi:transcriptional regulator with XRE-family HTH domain
MSDVLIANAADDIFWPPTERTEAQAPEVGVRPGAWIFGYLGSRVQSFSLGLDRVVVYHRPALAIDAWALGAKYTLLFEQNALWPQISATWIGVPAAWNAASQLVRAGFGESVGSIVQNPSADSGSAESSRPGLEAAIGSIKDALGLTDSQIESATGVSRSTLWRLRTGRTTGTRQATEAPVWRLRALADALVRALGAEGARAWIHSGESSLASALSRGDLAAVERAADRIIFRNVVERRAASAVADDDYPDAPSHPQSTAQPPRPPRRALRPNRSPQ